MSFRSNPLETLERGRGCSAPDAGGSARKSARRSRRNPAMVVLGGETQTANSMPVDSIACMEQAGRIVEWYRAPFVDRLPQRYSQRRRNRLHVLWLT